MTGLMIAIGLLAVGVGAVLIRPLLAQARNAASRAEFDLNIFRDQLEEVERDIERGLLDNDAGEAARIEIQRRILAADAEAQGESDGLSGDNTPISEAAAAGRRYLMPLAVAIGVPVAAVLFYLNQGSPEAPNTPYAARDIPQQTQQTQQASLAEGEHEGGVNAMIGRLAERLIKNPEDIDGWLLLGRSYISQRRFDDAMNAYKRARTIAPNRPDVEIAFAEALIATNDMQISDDAIKILRKVHEEAPLEPKSRYYLGLKKAQDGNVRGAVQDWTDLLALSPKDAAWVPLVKQQVMRGTNELNIDPLSLKPSVAAMKLRDQISVPSSISQVTGQPATGATDAPKVTRPPAPSSSAPTELRGPTREQVEAAGQMSAEDRNAMIRGMIQRLADRLKESPDDLAGWQRLERAYRVLGETPKADAAAIEIKRLSQ